MIEVKNLTKRFAKGESEVVAVNNLSFEVAPGEVFGLLGANGAGKTTSLRMILGLLTPTSGDALVEKYSVATDPDEVKRRIGYASASVGVYPWLTPKETLQFVGDLYDLEPEEQDDVPSTPGSLDQALQALESDRDFLLRGDVFTPDVLDNWIAFKRAEEVAAVNQRPHPYEFAMYFDC